jgi:pimeloyl-ACP methyl ester carboxylesterase
MELFYSLWNATSQPTQAVSKLVLLHGMGGTANLWRPLAATLEDYMAVLALDQRGHGKSQIPHIPGSRSEPSYTPLEYGKDVIETLESLQFQPSWILGHSMGVRTAVAAAHLRPEWVQGLFLIDLGFSGVAGGGLGEGLASFVKQLPPEFESREAARLFMTEKCPDPSIAQYLMAVSVKNSEGHISFPFDHSALVQTIYAARDASVRNWVHELGSRGMPIFVLRGAKSGVWSHEEFKKEQEYFSELKSVHFIEFENAGHGLPFEQRNALAELIRKNVLGN